uniref:Uncharacterized protein n=1 Tax=Arundo donax TaxID=35708 RepID=A0A0A9CHL6_ARUDO
MRERSSSSSAAFLC